MNNNQRFESISGLGAALLGFFALAYALFGSIYQGASSSGQGGTANMFQAGIQPITLVILVLLALALIGVAVSATLHSRTRENTWRIALGISAIVISAFTLLALPSIGLFLLPSALLALTAFVLSFLTRRVALG